MQTKHLVFRWLLSQELTIKETNKERTKFVLFSCWVSIF